MVRASFFLFMIIASGCTDGTARKDASDTPEIRVFADWYEFQGKRYDSAKELGIAMGKEPELVFSLSVSECAGDHQVAPVMDMLKDRNQVNIAFQSFSERCR